MVRHRRPKNFTMTPDHFTLDTSIRPVTRAVMGVLALHIRQRPWALPIEQIARECGLGRSTVRKAIASLVEAKYLEVDHNFKENPATQKLERTPSTFRLGPAWFEELPPF